MAEAVNRLGKLREDRRVDVDRRLEHEGVDVGLHLAGEFLEDEVLVLHLVGEAGSLEQALAVPDEGGLGLGRSRDGRDVYEQPLVQEGKVTRGQGEFLHLLDEVVVLGVEHVVDRGQADVLVAAAVTRDVVGVEQLVVVGSVRSARVDEAGRRAVGIRVTKGAVTVGHEDTRVKDRHGRMGDVVEEGVAGEDGVRQAHRVRRGARDHDVVGSVRRSIGTKADDDLRIAGFRMRDEVTVGVGAQQRNVADIGIGQVDAEHRLGLRLDVGPGGEATYTLEQVAGGDRLAVRAGHVFAQEDLMRGMRGVGLVLVDPRRGRVDGVAIPVAAGARHHHEVGVGCRVVERIVRLETGCRPCRCRPSRSGRGRGRRTGRTG